MTHPEDLLADYVRGTLPPSELAALEEHLSTCAHCLDDVGLARVARATLRTLPEVPAPAGIASKALELADGGAAHTRAGRTLYRGMGGAAAAAAVIVLAVASLSHQASAPSETKAVPALIGNAGGGASAAPALELTVQRKNYDQVSLDALTQSLAKVQPAAGSSPESTSIASGSATGSTGSDAELRTALMCVGKAAPPVDTVAPTPVKLIQARFDGEPAFFAFYLQDTPGQSPTTSLAVEIVDVHTCTASGSSTTPT
ncbi:MAG: zf-HC2 domain-containing protein [Actinomycetota bacterium]